MTLSIFTSYLKTTLTLSSKFIVSEKLLLRHHLLLISLGRGLFVVLEQWNLLLIKIEIGFYAKMLTAAYKNGQVRIAKFLSTSELEYIKKLRADCALLNKSSACFSFDGRNRYVVIDDHIMER